MNILVCIKQVSAPEAQLSIGADGRSVAVEDGDWRMNRFDEYAVEEALRIKATFPGSHVDAISVGPMRVAAVLRRALAMGVDQGVHILREGETEALSGEIAALIAACIRNRGYEVILAGVMAEDSMLAQTGPMLAEYLGMPCATAVMAETILPGGQIVRVEREIEGGCRAAVEMPLPALLTLQSGINRPRYPALSHVIRSRTQPVTIVPADGLAAPPRREHIRRIMLPGPAKKTLVLEGSAMAKARRLAQIFHEKALL